MKSVSCSKGVKILFIILTAALILFAFVNSSMPADVSDEQSVGVMNTFQNILNFLGFSAELTNHIVRKAAHFSEYTAIGGLLMTCAFTFNKEKPYKYSINIMFAGLLTAVCDEAIQLNASGRSGQITDVLLDFSGILFGSLIMLLVFTVYKLTAVNRNR